MVSRNDRRRPLGKKQAIAIVVALLGALIPLFASSRASNNADRANATSERSIVTRASANAPSNPSTASNRSDPRLRRIGFASRRGLESHWQKHGAEFGNPTLGQYLAMAQDLRDAPLSKTVVEAPQSNGSYARFDRRSGAFMAFNRDLTIRTFFRPDDGESYFRRAVNR